MTYRTIGVKLVGMARYGARLVVLTPLHFLSDWLSRLNSNHYALWVAGESIRATAFIMGPESLAFLLVRAWNIGRSLDRNILVHRCKPLFYGHKHHDWSNQYDINFRQTPFPFHRVLVPLRSRSHQLQSLDHLLKGIVAKSNLLQNILLLGSPRFLGQPSTRVRKWEE